MVDGCVSARPRRAVGRIIVDEDDFPVDPNERRPELGQQRGYVAQLIEGGDDDRQFDATAR